MPFTSGILIGIGETRRERIESLLALRDLHARYGHLQEIIVQNFRAKPGTRMADAPSPSSRIMLWTIAVARLVFGPAMNIQAPPNLSHGALSAFACCRHQRLGRRFAGDAGSRQSRGAVAARSTRSRAETGDGRQGAGRAPGGLSRLCARARAMAGPGAAHARSCERWTPRVMRAATTWTPGAAVALPTAGRSRAGRHAVARRTARPRARDGDGLAEAEIGERSSPRAASDFEAVCAAADELRAESRRRAS